LNGLTDAKVEIIPPRTTRQLHQAEMFDTSQNWFCRRPSYVQTRGTRPKSVIPSEGKLIPRAHFDGC
jgi:hypothetical protein